MQCRTGRGIGGNHQPDISGFAGVFSLLYCKILGIPVTVTNPLRSACGGVCAEQLVEKMAGSKELTRATAFLHVERRSSPLHTFSLVEMIFNGICDVVDHGIPHCVFIFCDGDEVGGDEDLHDIAVLEDRGDPGQFSAVVRFKGGGTADRSPHGEFHGIGVRGRFDADRHGLLLSLESHVALEDDLEGDQTNPGVSLLEQPPEDALEGGQRQPGGHIPEDDLEDDLGDDLEDDPAATRTLNSCRCCSRSVVSKWFR